MSRAWPSRKIADQIVSLLDTDQKATWNKLIGDRFDVKFESPPAAAAALISLRCCWKPLTPEVKTSLKRDVSRRLGMNLARTRSRVLRSGNFSGRAASTSSLV